ncbi:hypothetical protein EDD11_007056 [Mortierella claussenii]|nr:hypothetical protein EDD11_007056 [Mortierella claussenii]
MSKIMQDFACKALIHVRAHAPEKRISLGNQSVHVYFTSNESAAGFQNFLTRAILQRHHEIALEIQSQAPHHPPSPLKSFFNCLSTADVVILSPHADERPVYVHKAIVLAAIPNMLEFVAIWKNSISSITDGSIATEVGSETVVNRNEQQQPLDMPTDSGHDHNHYGHPKRKLDDTDAAVPNGSINDRQTPQKVKFSPTHESLSHLHDQQQGRQKEQDGKHSIDSVDRSCTTMVAHSAPTVASSDDIMSASLSASSPAIPDPSLVIRRNREVWFWPAETPRSSCLDVMRWIYEKQLSPVFQLQDFNSFMCLLEQLGQQHHFQEYALRAQGSIAKHQDPMALLAEPAMQEGYAKAYLLEHAKIALEGQWKTIEQRMTLHAVMNHPDPTGLLIQKICNAYPHLQRGFSLPFQRP